MTKKIKDGEKPVSKYAAKGRPVKYSGEYEAWKAHTDRVLRVGKQ
jgi:hypothetical protein